MMERIEFLALRLELLKNHLIQSFMLQSQGMTYFVFIEMITMIWRYGRLY